MMSKKYCRLSRTLLCVSGEDRNSFLQGLVTQDVTKITSTQSLYSLFLTPNGRFLHDFFLIPGWGTETILIETNYEE